MRKNDVLTRRNGRCRIPAINIKWWGFVPDMLHFKDEEHEFSGPDYTDFWTWVETSWDKLSDVFDACDEMTREQQYNDAKEDIIDFFGIKSNDVHSDGRSGGWMAVGGLSDAEGWDDEMLGRWDSACTIVKSYLDDMDYQYIWNLYVNFYEPFLERRAEEARRHTVTLTFVANGVTEEHWTSMMEDVEAFATQWACDHAAMLDDDTYQLEIS